MKRDPTERKLEDVVRALRNAKSRKSGAVFFIGAGCSFTGDIPTASHLCERIKDEHPDEYAYAEKHGDTRYQALMAALTDAERRELLSGYIDKARINWAHIGLAALIGKGYVDHVLTPNFDPLLVRACALLNEFPAIYDFTATQSFEPSYLHTPAISYIHGQRTGFRLLNTDDECAAHVETLEPLFDEAGRDRPWVTIGYSGENDPVFKQLLVDRRYTRRFFWVGYGDGDPPAHVARFVEAGQSRHFVRGFDADTFFVRLASALGCFPPALIGRPLAHLLDSLEMIAEYELPDEQGRRLDLLEGPRSVIQQAIAARASGTADSEAVDQLTTLRGQLMAGDPQAVIDVWRVAPSSELEDLAASAFNALGIEVGNRAAAEADPDPAVTLYREAKAHHAEAARLVPTNPTFQFNWGVALSDLAKRADRPEADGLLREAEARYAAAVNIKPDYYKALTNWGGALVRRADWAEGPEADRLLREAEAKYAAAVDAKPGYHEALNNWGVAIVRRASRAEGPEADRLLRVAEGKYAAAVDAQPGSPEALTNWGVALSRRAGRAEGAEADRLFLEAEAKYAAAADARPDSPKALANWGLAFMRRADRAEGPAADALLRKATAKLEAAQGFAPGEVYNLACVYALQGRESDARDTLRQALQAGTITSCEHLAEDADFAAYRDTDWFKQLLADCNAA